MYWWRNEIEFRELVGETFVLIENNIDEIIFTTNKGDVYRMYHDQDCCESVSVDDVVGDLNDLLNSPIVMAEEAIGDDGPKDDYDDSYTWTFYHLATVKGTVTIKWYGSSNGYYSERVSVCRMPKKETPAA